MSKSQSDAEKLASLKAALASICTEIGRVSGAARPGEEVGTSRADAKARGLRLFIADKPCSRGNVGPRRVSGKCACEPCRLAESARTLAWQHDPKNAERMKAHRAKDLENGRIRHRAAYHANPEIDKARARGWAKRNPARALEIKKKWAAANQDYLREMLEKRKLVERRARPAWFTRRWDGFVLSEAADLAKRRTPLTGISWERDHMIPLQGRTASGLHCAENIQVIPSVLNSRKGNRLMFTEPGEWIKAL